MKVDLVVTPNQGDMQRTVELTLSTPRAIYNERALLAVYTPMHFLNPFNLEAFAPCDRQLQHYFPWDLSQMQHSSAGQSVGAELGLHCLCLQLLKRLHRRHPLCCDLKTGFISGIPQNKLMHYPSHLQRQKPSVHSSCGRWIQTCLKAKNRSY